MPPEKRIKLLPSTTERIMIYVKQETEAAYTPLHLVSFYIAKIYVIVFLAIKVAIYLEGKRKARVSLQKVFISFAKMKG